MPLSVPTPRRALEHRRTIQAQAFRREDGLWDIDAHLTDIKGNDIWIGPQRRPAGLPLHDLWLRLTIDDDFNIVAVETASDATPYPGQCDQMGPDYGKMVGLSLARGFRAQLRERLGSGGACAHLSELAHILPTVAFQAFTERDAARRAAAESAGREPERPAQIGACRVLRPEGAVVAEFFPRWAAAALAGIET